MCNIGRLNSVSTPRFYDNFGFIPYFVEKSPGEFLLVQWNRILLNSRSQLLSGKQNLDIELVSVPIENQLWGLNSFDRLGRFYQPRIGRIRSIETMSVIDAITTFKSMNIYTLW